MGYALYSIYPYLWEEDLIITNNNNNNNDHKDDVVGEEVKVTKQVVILESYYPHPFQQ